METDPKICAIWEIAEPVALEAGLELVDIEHRREGHGTVLRLLMDRAGNVPRSGDQSREESPAGQGAGGGASPASEPSRARGVSIDELATISRQISDLLDVHADAVPGAYTLEVSSPGINRPLTRPAHFRSFVGKRVHVRTRVPIGDRHSFRGALAAVSDAGIVVAGADGERHEIPFSAIGHAHYQHDSPLPRTSGRWAVVPRAGHAGGRALRNTKETPCNRISIG